MATRPGEPLQRSNFSVIKIVEILLFMFDHPKNGITISNEIDERNTAIVV